MRQNVIPSGSSASAAVNGSGPDADSSQRPTNTGDPSTFTTMLAAALSGSAPSLTAATGGGAADGTGVGTAGKSGVGDLADSQDGQDPAALLEQIADGGKITDEMLALLASMAARLRGDHGRPVSHDVGAVAQLSSAIQSGVVDAEAASSPLASATAGHADQMAGHADDPRVQPPAAVTDRSGQTASSAAAASIGGNTSGRAATPLDPALIVDGASRVTSSDGDTESMMGRLPAPVTSVADADAVSPPAQTAVSPPAQTAAAELPPTAARAETASTHARLVARVFDALDLLENAPPPRRMTIEVPDADGLRLHVALRGAEVHVSVQGGGSPDLSGWNRELSAGLAARGFSLGGFNAGTGQERDPQRDRPPDDRQPSAAPTNGRRGERSPGDHDLRL